MSEDNYSFNLEHFNKEILKMIETDPVNTLQLFVMNDTSKVSITLESDKKYLDKYHGLSPKFDETVLKNFLYNNSEGHYKSINNSSTFWHAVTFAQKEESYMNLIIQDDNYKYFERDDFLVTLLGRAILQMSSHFGFTLRIEKKDLDSIYVFLHNLIAKNQKHEKISTMPNEEKDRFKKSLFWQFSDDWTSIHLKGIWPENMIKEFSYSFDFSEDTHIINKNAQHYTNSLYRLLTYNKEYANLFCNGIDSVYYSGVMPKVLNIRFDENPTAASNMKFLVFDVARTTYATIDMMDNPAIKAHDFLIECATRSMLMDAFDQHEDTIQADHLNKNTYIPVKENINSQNSKSVEKAGLISDPLSQEQRLYERWMILNINSYLRLTLNTNTIAVSANIKTKDDYLIIGKRGKLTIDNNFYYCSANGQSEFRDANVAFYRNSVYEDLPSMEYESEFRIDLNNEIQRESLAELGVSNFENDWSYYGVSYLCINNAAGPDNKIRKDIKNRRMHFNVLAHNTSVNKFADVVKSQKRATENFENENLRGIKLKVHKTRWDSFKDWVKSALNFFIAHKSNIFILYFIISIFMSEGGLFNMGEYAGRLTLLDMVLRFFDNIMNVGVKSIVDIFLFIIYIVTSIKEYRAFKPVRSLLIKKNYIINDFRNEIKNENKITYYVMKWDDIFTQLSKNSWMIKISIFYHQIMQKVRNKKEEKKSEKFVHKKEIENVHAIVRVMYSLYFFDKVDEVKK